MANLNSNDIDWALLQQYQDLLGQSGLKESVSMFMEVVPGYFAELERLISAANETGVRSQAHKLKGSCRSLGFQRLGQTMAFIEKEPWQWPQLEPEIQQWLHWFHQDAAIVNKWLQS